MTKKTRDTLYEYVYLTDLESSVARHPLFIRLHYIHQNSFTFLTYPTAHMQRHPHSLGTMHVAGEMFTHALKNTTSNDAIRDLVTDVVETLNTMKEGNFDELMEEVGKNGIEKLRSSESVYFPIQLTDKIQIANEMEMFKKCERTLALIVLLQATRLAALLHDVGHPPFSHIVEYGLQSALPKTAYADHEKVGIELSEIIFANVLDPSSIYSSPITTIFPKFSRICCDLAVELLSCEKGHALYGFKASVLSGDFDADRIDYVRRDIESTGITATTYDLGRILDGLHIDVQPVALGTVRQVKIAVSPKVLSAIETFFIARFHLYRWAIFHHDVTRRNLSMQRFVHLILTVDEQETSAPLIELRERLTKLATDPDKRRDYKYFTDGYFVELLWRVFDYCEANNANLSEDERDLYLYCDIVLNRNNQLMRTLWKRPDHYHAFCLTMKSIVPKGKRNEPKTDTVSAFNGFLMSIFEKWVEKNNHTRDLSRYLFSQELEVLATSKLKGSGHRLFVNYNASFTAGPSEDFSLITPNTTDLISITDISPMVDALRTAWMKSPQLMVFYKGSRNERPDSIGTLRSAYYAAVKESLGELAVKYGIVDP